MKDIFMNIIYLFVLDCHFEYASDNLILLKKIFSKLKDFYSKIYNIFLINCFLLVSNSSFKKLLFYI